MIPAHLKLIPRRVVRAIVDASVSLRWLVLLLGSLITAGATVYTANNIAIDTDTTDMIDVRLPHRQAFLALKAAFPRLPGDIVVYTQADHAGLAEDAADALVAKLRAKPGIARAIAQPGGGEFFGRNGLVYLSTDELWQIDQRLNDAGPLIGALARDPSLRGLLVTLREALARPLDDTQQALLGRLFERLAKVVEKPDGAPVHWRDELFAPGASDAPRRAFVLIDPALEETSFQPEQAALDGLHELLQEMQQAWPEVRFHLTGSVPMNAEELVTVAEDAGVTTALSFLCVAIVLVWGLRSPTLVFAVLVTLACGLVWTAALATWLVGSLNIISVCFAVLFIGMGVDFGIQYAMRYLEESDRGRPLREALSTAADGAGGALVLAAVGAAICFAAFVPTSYKGLAQLGVISSFSMVVALVASITLLPAVLSFLRAPAQYARPQDDGEGKLSAFVARHGSRVLWGSAALSLGGLVLLPRAEFDPNPANLKDPQSPAVQAFLALAQAPETSPYYIELLAPSLAEAQALGKRLGSLPSVDKALTLASFVPESQTERLEVIDGMRMALTGVIDVEPVPAPSLAEEAAAVEAFREALGAQRARLTVPSVAAAAARLDAGLAALVGGPDWQARQLPALRSRLLGDLPQTLDRLRRLLEAGEFGLEDLPEDLRLRYLAADGRARVEVYAKDNLNDNGAMRRFVREVTAVAPDATGAPVELVIGSEVVIDACFKASVAALILTILLHALVLHGWVDALLVAAPLVLAMLLTIATSVLAGFPLNFANIIALPLLIGLNNAYGAYLVVRRKHSEGLAPLLESSTPRAVLFSGLTAVASFGTLAVSKHPGMAGMGILIALSLGYALASALIMLPALMAAVERWQARGGQDSN